jgi:hypothetical protein
MTCASPRKSYLELSGTHDGVIERLELKKRIQVRTNRNSGMERKEVTA